MESTPTIFNMAELQTPTVPTEHRQPIIMFKWGSKEKPFRCPECHIAFENVNLLNSHVAKHNLLDPSQFRCDLCSKSFCSQKNLTKHTQLHYGQGTKRCKFCYRIFHSRDALDEHQATHNGAKPFKCDECPKQFAFQSAMEMHKLCHSGHRPFQCEICEKRFNRKDILEKHQVVHSGEKPQSQHNKCVECGKVFTRIAGLRQHARTVHNGERKIEWLTCPICHKVVSQRSGLKLHMMVHASRESRAFKCNVCDKAYTHKSVLRDHMVVHTGATPHQCLKCGQTFKYKGSLYKHRHIVHLEYKAHTCEFCGKRFVQKRLYDNHLRQHVYKKFQCGHCKKLFQVKAYYLSHLQKYHGDSGIESKDLELLDDGIASSANKQTNVYFRTETRADGAEVQIGSCSLDNKSIKLQKTARKSKDSSEGIEEKEKAETESATPFQCSKCGKTFKHKWSLYTHQHIVHLEYKAHTCEFCGKRFVQKRLYDNHLRQHVYKKFQCGHCKKLFRVKAYYLSHLQKYHGDSGIESKDLELLDDGIASSTKKQTNVYFRTETTADGVEVEIGSCTLDDRSVKLQKTARKSKDSSEGIEEKEKAESESHSCQICHKVMSSKQCLSRHMDIHTGKRAFQCDMCGMAFRQRPHLNTHMKIHTETRTESFQCLKCDKSFKNKRALFHHRQIVHMEFNAHTCELCGRRFVTKKNYDIHLRQHIERAHQCGYCKALFELPASLQAHIQTEHSDVDVELQTSQGPTPKVNITGSQHHMSAHTYYKTDLDDQLSSLIDGLHNHTSVQHQDSSTISAHIDHGYVRQETSVDDQHPGIFNGQLNHTSVEHQHPSAFNGHHNETSVENQHRSIINGYHNETSVEDQQPSIIRLLKRTNAEDQHPALTNKLDDNGDTSHKTISTKSPIYHETWPFTCRKCSKGFNSNTNLVQHEKICHNAGTKKTCQYCNESYVHLRIHQKKRCPALGKQQRQYRCEICQVNFLERTYLKEHMWSKHKEPRYSCPKCNKKYAYRSSIIRHKKICGVSDGRVSDIERTMEREFAEVNAGTNEINNTGSSPVAAAYVLGINAESGEIDDECVGGGSSVLTATRVLVINTESGEIGDKCVDIGSSLLAGTSVLISNTESGKIDDKCVDIGSSLLAGTSVLIGKTESGKIDDGCVGGDDMPDNGRMKSDLVHPSAGVSISAKSPMHHKPRPFTCRKCNKRFISNANLVRHEKICQNTATKKICRNTATKKTCQYCNESFVHLRIHQKKRCPALGKQQRQYRCEICQVNFLERTYLKEHIRSKHKEPRYACPKCNKKYAYRSTLIHHKKICGVSDGRASDIERKMEGEFVVVDAGMNEINNTGSSPVAGAYVLDITAESGEIDDECVGGGSSVLTATRVLVINAESGEIGDECVGTGPLPVASNRESGEIDHECVDTGPSAVASNTESGEIDHECVGTGPSPVVSNTESGEIDHECVGTGPSPVVSNAESGEIDHECVGTGPSPVVSNAESGEFDHECVGTGPSPVVSNTESGEFDHECVGTGPSPVVSNTESGEIDHECVGTGPSPVVSNAESGEFDHECVGTGPSPVVSNAESGEFDHECVDTGPSPVPSTHMPDKCVNGENMPDDGRMESDLVDPSVGSSISAKSPVHHETQPFLCSKCGKRFYSYYILLRHETACHKYATKKTKKTCEFCNRSYLHLDLHQERCPALVQRQLQYQCGICQVKFVELRYLQEHIQYKHEEPRYSCTRCSKKFSFRATFNNHKKVCGLLDGYTSVH